MRSIDLTRSHASWRFFLTAVAVVVGVTGVGLYLQWNENVHLRTQRELGLMELDDTNRLKAENRRLREFQLSAADLERLRADHAALVRLRAEFESLAGSGSKP